MRNPTFGTRRDSACDMGAMSSAVVHGIVIGFQWRCAGVVVVACEVIPNLNETAWTKTAAKRWMSVIDSAINNSDTISFACDALFVQLVNLSHDMRRKGIFRCSLPLDVFLLSGCRDVVLTRTCRDTGRPYVLHLWLCPHLTQEVPLARIRA
jgi:hypothetical protein